MATKPSVNPASEWNQGQWPVHECPPWCHACPLMAGGSVMPMCWGVIVSFVDEYDLTSCTCNPSDPAVARLDLVRRTETLIRLLRDKRRARQTETIQTKRFLELVPFMKFWTRDDWRRHMPFIENFAQTLRSKS